MIDIPDLLSKVDIVDYVSQYVHLERRGKELVGLSPFNSNDTDPSFTITPDRQLYYDFSIASGGNVLSFVQKYHHCDIHSALERLIVYTGGDVKKIPEQLEATKIIRKFRKKSATVRPIKYKKLPEDIMDKYDFNVEKMQIWIEEGIPLEVLEKYQVRYDPFSNRLVFPIWDGDGNIVNVKGRTLDTDYKKNKLRKYDNFYPIGRMDYVYNLNFSLEHIRQAGSVIIFESEKSVWKAIGYGINNTIAIMTSHLNDDQFLLLVKLGVDCIFALDKNVDVRSIENISKLRRFVRVEFIYDSCDFIGEKDAPIDHGYDVFKRLYDERVRL